MGYRAEIDLDALETESEAAVDIATHDGSAAAHGGAEALAASAVQPSTAPTLTGTNITGIPPAGVTGTAVVDADTRLTDARQDDARNGLEDGTKFPFTYDPATMRFTITVGADAAYWVDGVRYTPAAGADSPAAHAATSGTWYLVYNDSGVLTVSSSIDLSVQSLVGMAYYNATTGKGIWLNERHPNTMPWSVHRWMHTHRGAQLVSGGTIADYTLQDPTDMAPSFAQTVFDDENLRSTLNALASGGPYSIVYRSGADADDEWNWDLTPVLPFLDDGDDPQYNQLTGGNWQQTAIATNNRYFNMWAVGIPAYNDAGDNYKLRFSIIQAQSVHSTRRDALDESFTGLSFGTFPSAEIVPLQKITMRRVVAAGKNARIERVTSLLGTNISFVNNLVQQHSALSGKGFDEAGHTGFQRETYNSASADPTADNDSADTAGLGVSFRPGDRWIRLDNGKKFELEDSSVGAAVWAQMLDAGDVGIAAPVAPYNPDGAIVVLDGGVAKGGVVDALDQVTPHADWTTTADAGDRTITWSATGMKIKDTAGNSTYFGSYRPLLGNQKIQQKVGIKFNSQNNASYVFLYITDATRTKTIYMYVAYTGSWAIEYGDAAGGSAPAALSDGELQICMSYDPTSGIYSAYKAEGVTYDAAAGWPGESANWTSLGVTRTASQANRVVAPQIGLFGQGSGAFEVELRTLESRYIS